MAITIEYIELNDNFDKWRDKINKMISTVRSVEEYPSQEGKDGYLLSTDGTNVKWIPKSEIFDEFGINVGGDDATVFPSGISVGNFACNIDENGNITTSGKVTANSGFFGDLTGNASTATTLKTAIYLDGVSFNGSADNNHYGTCDSVAATAEKAITCSGFALKTGSRIHVTFTNTNTAALTSVKLNVNSTGAKAFYIPGTNKTKSASYVAQLSGLFCSGCLYTFVYDGTAYYIESISHGIPTYDIPSSASIDLNRCIYPGIYYSAGASTITNTPNGNTTGWLEVVHILNQSMIKQIWYTNGTANTNDYLTYVRTSNNGSTFGNWFQFYGDKGNMTVNGTLTVTAAFTANTTAKIIGALTASSTLTCTGAATFNNTISCSNNISATGTVTGSKVLNAVYNDYAEFFERGESTEEGDIIALDSNSEKEQYVKGSYTNPNIVGVDSRSYGHLIGGEIVPEGEDFEKYNLPKFIPVGIVGRVPVKVIGKVHKGDTIILSDIPGVGKAKTSEKEFYKVGFAVENSENPEIKLVKIKISL